MKQTLNLHSLIDLISKRRCKIAKMQISDLTSHFYEMEEQFYESLNYQLPHILLPLHQTYYIDLALWCRHPKLFFYLEFALLIQLPEENCGMIQHISLA